MDLNTSNTLSSSPPSKPVRPGGVPVWGWFLIAVFSAAALGGGIYGLVVLLTPDTPVDIDPNDPSTYSMLSNTKDETISDDSAHHLFQDTIVIPDDTQKDDYVLKSNAEGVVFNVAGSYWIQGHISYGLPELTSSNEDFSMRVELQVYHVSAGAATTYAELRIDSADDNPGFDLKSDENPIQIEEGDYIFLRIAGATSTVQVTSSSYVAARLETSS